MSLKTTVKVSHISNLSDARYCAGMGVEMLGVSVIPSSENYMPPQVFQEIRGWISGPKIIAELYGLEAPEQLAAVIEIYAPDHLELTLEEYKKFGRGLSLPCIVYVPVGVSKSFPIGSHDNISHLLVQEGTLCEELPGDVPVLTKVASVKTLKEKLEQGCFKGIVIEGPMESRPGLTSHKELGAILEALEED